MPYLCNLVIVDANQEISSPPVAHNTHKNMEHVASQEPWQKNPLASLWNSSPEFCTCVFCLLQFSCMMEKNRMSCVGGKGGKNGGQNGWKYLLPLRAHTVVMDAAAGWAVLCGGVTLAHIAKDQTFFSLLMLLLLLCLCVCRRA